MTCNNFHFAEFIYNRSIFIKPKLFGFLLCPLLLISPVHAAKSIEECQKYNIEKIPDFSMSQCLDSVIGHVERELQIWINLHTFNLEEKTLVNGRDSALKMFKRSQNDFVTYFRQELEKKNLS